MISVIVSSKSAAQFQSFSQNIQETIGVIHEVVRVENPEGKLGLAAAYNDGACRAKYQYLCFIHEDVLIRTENWGDKIIKHFQANPEVGLIGTSGGIYKKRMLSNWGEFENNSVNIRRVNIIQRYKFSAQPAEHIYHNPLNEEKSYVVNMDGVFLCSPRDVWKKNKFDERLLKGFHAYDFDFSMQIVQSKKLLVVYDVLLEHFSEGVCDLNWYDAALAAHLKWKNKLPVAVDLSIARGIDIYNSDWNLLRYIIRLYIQFDVNYFKLFKVYASLFSLVNYSGKSSAVIKDFISEWIKITCLFLNRARK